MATTYSNGSITVPLADLDKSDKVTMMRKLMVEMGVWDIINADDDLMHKIDLAVENWMRR